MTSALFHIGQVTLPKAQQVPVPEVGVAGKPADAEVAALHAALPQQPVHTAVVLAGNRVARRLVGPRRASNLGRRRPRRGDRRRGSRRRADPAGRRAGPVAPGPVRATGSRRPAGGLRGRTAPEGDRRAGPAEAHLRDGTEAGRTAAGGPQAGAGPVAVPTGAAGRRPGGRRERAGRRGGRPPSATAAATCWRNCTCSTCSPASRSATGKRSLAYSLRFRAPDRTLTVEEATAARDSAVAAAASRFGAALRS